MRERKYLAHFIDEAFGGNDVAYVRLGKDLEEYYEDLNPDTETQKNILGERNLRHSGFSPQNEVSPFYPEEGSALGDKVMEIANERITGNACHTTVVDVLLKADGTQEWAYREEVAVVPTQIGGSTDGVQAPFQIHRIGNRVKGTFDMTAKTFTPQANSVNAG